MALARPSKLSSAGLARVPVLALTLVASVVVGATFRQLDPGGPMAPNPSPPAATGSPSADDAYTPALTPTPRATPTASPTPSAAPTASPSPTAVPTPLPTPRVTPAPSVAAPPPPANDVLPPCAYSDVLTLHHGLGEWSITLLDTIYQVPSSYAPGDLVDSSAAGLNGGYAVRSVMLADLAAMAAAARSAGAPIQLVSGYRSYSQQKATFDHWVSVGGYEQALRTSARPGHSEHQLGTAIDVTSEGGAAPWTYADWASTPAGAWMAANAWRYGFVMSYPRGSSDVSCYSYEPWHYRYVGRDLAAEVAGSGRVLRQVLWELQ